MIVFRITSTVLRSGWSSPAGTSLWVQNTFSLSILYKGFKHVLLLTETRSEHSPSWHHQTHDSGPSVRRSLPSGWRMTHPGSTFDPQSVCSVVTVVCSVRSCSQWSERSSPTSMTSLSSSPWWEVSNIINVPSSCLSSTSFSHICSSGAFPAVPRHVPEGQREGWGLQVHHGGLHQVRQVNRDNGTYLV